ncbi:MAG TPA: hypothetical protein VJO12_11515 [Stellaceae bacterium]|nr:hypothetical protein [Stellaceae bacterium]
MYRVHIRRVDERKQIIAQDVAATTKAHPIYEYQNKRTDLPLIRVDINIPIYRMANYRTRTAQMKYVHDSIRPPDFFAAGQENESAQQAQHDILVGFAKQGRAESVSPIFDELESEDQQEPLLITTGGVVVNGNRRLAAMRELFAEKPSEHRSFSHVDCAVLPESVTPDEIREIEIRLQMRPETKLPYGWVNESLAIQELLGSGRKIEQVIALMKKKKKDIERSARALTEADIYLKEWLRAPGEYQYVEDAEQFFGDLATGLGGKQGEMLEASRRIAWALISNAKKLSGGRVYNYNFSFGQRAEEVLSGLAERLDIDTSPQPKDDDGGLDIDLGDEEGTTYEPIIDAFDDAGRRSDVAKELIAVCDSILEKDRQGEIGRQALAAVQAANNKLQEVDLSKADSATYKTIETQLDAVIQRANKLKTNIQAYIKGK